SGTSGSSAHMRETIRALRARGHEVLLLSPHVAPAAPDGLVVEIPALVARDEAAPEHLGRELRVMLFCEHVRGLGSEIAAFAPDIVYERYALFGTAGGQLAGDLGVPLVLEVNAPLYEEQVTHRKLALRRTAGRPSPSRAPSRTSRCPPTWRRWTSWSSPTRTLQGRTSRRSSSSRRWPWPSRSWARGSARCARCWPTASSASSTSPAPRRT